MGESLDKLEVKLAAKFISKAAREKAPTAYGTSFPIRNVDELKRAIQSIGRAPASKRAQVKAHIKRRAKALGATNLIPEGW
jgi:hypothetical protein